MAKPKVAKDRDIIDEAMRRLKRCVEAEKHNRTAAVEDLEFANAEQWPAEEIARRKISGRPMLSCNLLTKYIDQVVGDMLHNMPSVKVRPEDSRADINIAKIRQGAINNIFYLSNFKGIYGYAARQVTTCAYGGWRILTRYTEENPFLQEAFIKGIRNPLLVYLDPDAQDQFGADAKFGFILEKIRLDDYKKKYPRSKFASDSLPAAGELGKEHWYDGENVTVAEYFTVEEKDVEMLQLTSGEVVTQKDYEEKLASWQERNDALSAKIPAAASNVPGPPQGAQQVPPPHLQAPLEAGRAAGPQPVLAQLQAEIEQLGSEPRIARRRVTKVTEIRHRVLTACEILEGGLDGKKFPGKYIPIVLPKGKELNVNGKNYNYSLIRNAKDPQKLFNYWHTAAAEYIALSPKAPWIGTAKQFEGYEADYAKANVENLPFMKYNADPDTQTPPQRVGAPQVPDAIFAQISRAEELVKSTIGMFNADVGAPGSEQTGAAIIARQRPGDVGTYEFSVNMARAVEHTGKILNEIIPEIYDSERDIRLRFMDETETFAPVNTTVGAALRAVKDNPEAYNGLDVSELQDMANKEGREARFNDITAGKYGVVVTTGPSYATQRQEASQALLQLMQAAPQEMATALDLVARNLDFKDADELESRLRKPLLAKGIIKPRAGEEVPEIPPDQAAQAEMATAQARVQVAQVALERESLQVQEAALRLKAEIAKIQAATGNKIDTTVIDAIEKERKHSIEAARVMLERERLDHQRTKDRAEFMLKARQIRNGGKRSGN